MNISEMQSQTIARFKQPVFATNFAVDNNPMGVIEQIKKMGYESLFTGDLVSDKVIAKKLILTWYANKQTQDILDVLNSVNYINEGGHTLPYTRGYIDYFRENTNSKGVDENAYNGVDSMGMKFSWDGLLTALGAGLTTYGQISGNGNGYNGEPTQAQIEAEQAEKKRKTWNIIAWIIGIIILLALIVVLIKYFKNK